MPRPEEKAAALVSDINAMINESYNPTRLDEIKRQIRLVEAGGFYSDAKQLEGMIAGLEGNGQEVHSKFHAAITCASIDRIDIRINYARALANAQWLMDAIEQVEIILDESPDDIGALKLALEFHEHAYNLGRVYSLVEMLSRLGQKDVIPFGSLQKNRHVEQVIRSSGVAWRDVAERIKLASTTVFNTGLNAIFPITKEIATDDGFLLEFSIPGGIENAIRAEDAIHEVIAAQPYSAADSVISFTCLPA